jgi:hypothetical protein
VDVQKRLVFQGKVRKRKIADPVVCEMSHRPGGAAALRGCATDERGCATE